MYYNYSILLTSCLMMFSGYYSSGVNAGTFYLNVSYSATNSSAAFGGRLMFL